MRIPIRRSLAVLTALLISAALATPCTADDGPPEAKGKVKLQFRTSPLVHNDQEIEVLRVKPDGTTETVTDKNGEPLKGKPEDLEERTEGLGKESARVEQDYTDTREDTYTIRLPEGVYIIRVTDPTNPEEDRSVETPKFRVPGSKDIKVRIGVRLAPGSKQAGDQLKMDERFVVKEETTPSHSMAPTPPDRPVWTFNVGFLAGAGIGGPKVKLTQDALSDSFRGEDDSVGGVFAADIYFLADLGQIADLPSVGDWTPVVGAGVFAGVEDVGGQDRFSHRLDLVNPIDPDTKVEIGGASGFWAPHLAFGFKKIGHAARFYIPTQFVIFGGLHQSNSEVDVTFEQPGGTTKFHEEDDDYNPMVGLRVGSEFTLEMFGEEQEIYYNLVYFHVFDSGGSSTTKQDQFGNEVRLEIDSGDRDFFMLGVSVPFDLLP